jgi:hypothetical protein
MATITRETSAAIAIGLMWLVVFAVALFGPDIVSTSATAHTTIPSGVVIALFAWLGTIVIAKRAFGDRHDDS